MEKTNQKTGIPTQGVRKTFTESEFRKMIENDLKSSVSFLMAVVNDPNTINAINEYMYGKYLNQIHQKELQDQMEINK